ncbi:MAG: MarR family transcriptional regulator [Eubacteriales bacterium]|nr:MarR family transcriptional regulator [Eubacteriales bacterium]
MKELLTVQLKRINHLSSEIDAAYHEAAQRFGLSDSAMQILYAICNNGEKCLLSDICNLSGTSKQTINSAIRKLEAEGIVYLETFSGRKKNVCLTAKGKNLMNHTVVRLIKIENDIFSSWTKPEQELYLELMQRYLTSFRDKIEEL